MQATVCLLSVLALVAADVKPPTPINVGFNTTANEDDPHITASGAGIYYSSDPDGKWGIYLSQKRSGRFQAGKVPDDWIATEGDDRGVYAMPESRTQQFLYYATTKDKKQTASFDLYVVVKDSPTAAFAARKALSGICTPADEMHPWLANDGLLLYFSRKTDEGWRIFVSKRPNAKVAQGFTEPQLIKELPPDFHHATLTADGKTMYLQGPVGNGRRGLFVSNFDNKEWSKPVELNVNHPEGTVGSCSPCLTRDGTALYFASDRPGGKGKLDVWAIYVEQLKKK